MHRKITGEQPVIAEIDVHEAWQKLNDGDAVLLDVRELDEVRKAGVPGSLHIPFGKLTVEGQSLPKDRELLVICHSGGRSAMATEVLNVNGYDRATNIA